MTSIFVWGVVICVLLGDCRVLAIVLVTIVICGLDVVGLISDLC